MIEIRRQENNRILVDGVESNLDKIGLQEFAVKKRIPVSVRKINQPFLVLTLEGAMQGKAGDWLITGVQGEMYPCDAAIFEQSFDLVT